MLMASWIRRHLTTWTVRLTCFFTLTCDHEPAPFLASAQESQEAAGGVPKGGDGVWFLVVQAISTELLTTHSPNQ